MLSTLGTANAVHDEQLVEAAGMYGFDRLKNLISLSGFVALPEIELRDELNSLGYLNEWLQASDAAAEKFGCVTTDNDIDERNRYRNRLFLSCVARDMKMEPLLALN